MEWIFKKLFGSRSAISQEFTAAGCLFTDGAHVLAGYQPNKRQPTISGLGGKKANGETYTRTALRETLEELFNMKVNGELLDLLETTAVPRRIVVNGQYVVLYYTFHDLETLLRYASSYCSNTNLYEDFPLTLNELIFNRDYTQHSEVSHLCLLPFVEGIEISADFKSDIKGLKGSSE